jgi:hypothetical protein
MILFISSLGERVLTHFSGKKESLLQVKSILSHIKVAFIGLFLPTPTP